MTPTLNRPALDRVIAVINGKGGVLKTTLTANIGGMLASSGFRVLLVDLDPQGNLAEDLGYTDDNRDDAGRALAQALMFGGGAEPLRDVRPNLDVFAGGPALDQATAGLAAKANKDPDGAKLAVAHLLEPLANNYDMIIIDCPPGDETLQTAAVAAARWALVPVKSDKSSRKGLGAVAARLDAVLSVNPTLDLLGVVLVDVGTSAHVVQREAREHIAQLFNADHNVVFTATVRHSEATAQATRERGLLVHELDVQVRKGPKWYDIRRGEAQAQPLAPRTAGSVADDLQAITQEVVARITAAEKQSVRA
ncbi:ParA family protein [Cryobacterium sp. Y11]|uniref:ParA family protein n=1 Tax=Cryobacterium sp. Y11 TaxID=2045016 RepID=UPI000CE2E88A|nr:ParA family protein [Cryobacterium sp. Y11]